MRVAVAEAMAEAAQEPATGPVHVTLQLHAPIDVGDLDTFVTGVCDGLMPVHIGAPIALDWREVPKAARPDRALCFFDDGQVTKIEAERIPPDSARQRYVLVIQHRGPRAGVEWSSDVRTVTVRMEREGPNAESVCQAAVAMVRDWAEGYAKIGPEAELTINCQANEIS